MTACASILETRLADIEVKYFATGEAHRGEFELLSAEYMGEAVLWEKPTPAGRADKFPKSPSES
jgi:hypothetical protein